eukprot:COSAG01_NODE_367_length_18064_cov_23.990315_9_plen_92_part_00
MHPTKKIPAAAAAGCWLLLAAGKTVRAGASKPVRVSVPRQWIVCARVCQGIAGLEPSDMDELLALVSPRGGDGAGAGAAGAPSAGAPSAKE